LEGAVYILCSLTALACGVLLLRGYGRSRMRLLLWCGVFFLAMAAENALLFIDVVIVPDVDLSDVRRIIPLIGVLLLLYGLIWETKS
jgi:hypothetical protein